MEKPDDTSVWAWEKADDVLMSSPLTMVPNESWDACRKLIASALDAAVDDERNAIIQMCKEEGEQRRKNANDCMTGSWEWGIPEVASMAQLHKAVTADSIAEKIRSRSNS